MTFETYETSPQPQQAAAPAAVTVIGCDGRPLPETALAALQAASAVAGAQRHLDTVDVPPATEQIAIKHLDTALDAICKSQGPVAVLASGDPGFFGIVRALRARGIKPHVIPAASSVALAFASLGMDWDDALVLSAHGREPRQVLAAALAHPKVAILTAHGDQGPSRLGTELLNAGRQVHVAERLGSPEERVTALADDPTRDFAAPNVLIAVDPAAPSLPQWLAGHTGAPPGWALPEDQFEHRDSMITKAEVRALVLAKLGPAPGRTIWDIGSGSGSVAVECARFGAWVVAIDSDQDQCARIRKNAATHGVYLRVRAGHAPEVLADLPQADAVFVGGGDNDVIAAAARIAAPERIVVTLASLDRVSTVHNLLASLGYAPQGVQLQASRLAPLPAGALRLAAENPVFVLWGERQK
jgi:precorrin-6Y C5,15-methyltransferase (decarboxylating)